jgi:hypothetical protein
MLETLRASSRIRSFPYVRPPTYTTEFKGLLILAKGDRVANLQT